MDNTKNLSEPFSKGRDLSRILQKEQDSSQYTINSDFVNNCQSLIEKKLKLCLPALAETMNNSEALSLCKDYMQKGYKFLSKMTDHRISSAKYMAMLSLLMNRIDLTFGSPIDCPSTSPIENFLPTTTFSLIENLQPTKTSSLTENSSPTTAFLPTETLLQTVSSLVTKSLTETMSSLTTSIADSPTSGVSYQPTDAPQRADPGEFSWNNRLLRIFVESYIVVGGLTILAFSYACATGQFRDQGAKQTKKTDKIDSQQEQDKSQ